MNETRSHYKFIYIMDVNDKKINKWSFQPQSGGKCSFHTLYFIRIQLISLKYSKLKFIGLNLNKKLKCLPS